MGRKVILALCFAVLLGTDARAEEQDFDAARQAFDKATKLFEQNKYFEAKEAFKLAYRLRPHYRVQCTIGRCYQVLGDVIKAAEHYRRCLKEGAASAPMAADARGLLKEAAALITWIDIRSPGGGGTVLINGRQVGRAPGRFPFNPGKHVIRVEREGARPAITTIRTLGGEQRELTLVPSRAAESTPPASTVSDRPRRRLSRVWFWTAAGATVALGTGIIIAGVLTRQARSAYNSDPTRDGLDSFKSRRLATNVLVGLTATAAVGTSVLFFFTDFGGKESPVEGKHATLFGVGLRGTF